MYAHTSHTFKHWINTTYRIACLSAVITMENEKLQFKIFILAVLKQVKERTTGTKQQQNE